MPKTIHMETADRAEVIVCRTHILQTNIVIYSAWEPNKSFGDYAVVSMIDGEWYGQIGTKCFGARRRALPDAANASKVFYGDQERIAHDCIIKAFPHLDRPIITGRSWWDELDQNHVVARKSGYDIVEMFESIFDAKASCL